MIEARELVLKGHNAFDATKFTGGGQTFCVLARISPDAWVVSGNEQGRRELRIWPPPRPGRAETHRVAF